jgi:hypothetical protein
MAALALPYDPTAVSEEEANLMEMSGFEPCYKLEYRVSIHTKKRSICLIFILRRHQLVCVCCVCVCVCVCDQTDCVQAEEERWVESMIAIIVSVAAMPCLCPTTPNFTVTAFFFIHTFVQIEERAFEKGKTHHIVRVRDVSLARSSIIQGIVRLCFENRSSLPKLCIFN